MSSWIRHAPLCADWMPERQETWEYRPPDRPTRSFDLQVRAGKPLDVMSLRSLSVTDLRSYHEFLEQTAKRLYGADRTRRQLKTCPCCRADTASAAAGLTVFGVPYVRCSTCGHLFVREQPTEAALRTVFQESEGHASIYVDRDSLESRMGQVIAPKVKWCLDLFASLKLGRPQRSLDVGAGGGHFVAGMQRAGVDAVGLEMSRTSVAFARQVFGLELRTDDFLHADQGSFDLITFWGLLEYTPRPRDFIGRARRIMGDRPGLLVVEVPRADSLGTRVQMTERAVVARHMDPTTHVNTFSDEALCTAIVEEGFRPVAVWYFGMDIYELMVQVVARLGDDALMERLADMIPMLQQSCDLGRQCDDIVVGAVPM